MDFETKVRLEALERKAYSSGTGSNITIAECYITNISDDGTRILVSPLSQKDSVFEAIALSPIPTSMVDGRRLQGMPTAKNAIGGETEVDHCVCLVIEGKFYITGYYNLGDGTTGERVSLVKETEQFHPFRNGLLLKISKTAQIVIRKANWIKTYLGLWSNIDAKGEIPGQASTREPLYTIKWTNYIQRTWGGFNKWLRVKADSGALESPTTHVSMQGKYHEPDILSDVNLEQTEKNTAIDEVEPTPGSNIPAKNRDNLNYVDKVIKRSGTISDDTHVYEREVRQSKETDKEKTVFTRLREGHREGVLSEYETEDVLAFTKTVDKLGSNVDGANGLALREYIQYDEDNETPIDKYFERFGGTDSDILYKKEIEVIGDLEYSDIETLGTDSEYIRKYTDTEGATVTITKDITGMVVAISGDNNVTITARNDGNYQVNADTKIVVEAPNIEIGAGSTEALVLGNALETWLTNWVNTTFNTHIHATGVGPSAPPTTPGTPPTAGEFLSPTHTIK